MNTEANPFNLEIKLFAEPEPSEAVLPAAAFDLLEQAQAALEQAQTQADLMRHEAEQEAVQIRATASELGAEEKAALICQTQDEARDQTVTQGLRWLADEAQLEASIIDQLEARVRSTMASVLQEWLEGQDQIAQLARQLAAQVRVRARQRPYQIRLHPTECESVAAQLAQSPDLAEVHCLADAALTAGQAIIDMEFLRIEFDLTRHWAQVLAALRGETSSASVVTTHTDEPVLETLAPQIESAW
ncbi:FliH/SctL family protein [Mycoavidus cysteinexigens]|uniref:FliH/SctL family protein n=1 Tax=Mycoavidus cysteinexigens TaxID=1553431 RepID=UPI0005EED3B4|nr:FliH/SctL family protein [Mycoavidus cysteinexigens]GAM52949.1 type III secretion protein SsaK [bacterium endosymbiont of Mortierella elongata FMR23-6]